MSKHAIVLALTGLSLLHWSFVFTDYLIAVWNNPRNSKIKWPLVVFLGLMGSLMPACVVYYFIYFGVIGL